MPKDESKAEKGTERNITIKKTNTTLQKISQNVLKNSEWYALPSIVRVTALLALDFTPFADVLQEYEAESNNVALENKK